ncbi:MAG: hypothetical protein CMM84_12170 [Rhodothermaceae bacterium]|nr:hypothetical protein [Rhodothermaceae bacterium]
MLARLRSAFAVHPHGPTLVSDVVERDLAAQARRRARVLAWAGLLVNLPLFYVDEYISYTVGAWAEAPAYHVGLLVWRVVAVLSLGGYLVWDRRAPFGPPHDARLSRALAVWFILLGGAFGIWFEPNAAALPLYAFTLLMVAAFVHPPTPATVWAALATIPLIVVGALLYGTPVEVVTDWVEFPFVVVALAVVVDRTLYRQAYRTLESAHLLGRANAELETTLSELRATQDRLVAAERQAERTRISRDLHDSVGAQLSSLLAGIELARLREEAPVGVLGEVEEDAREAMRQLRETVWVLNASEVTVEALAAQLRRFAEARARASGIHAAVQATGDRYAVVPAASALHLYRVGQEAVQNAVKHSGAKTISVRLTSADGRLTLSVRDDGAFRPPVTVLGDGAPSGFGMASMRERASTLGGTFDLAIEAGTEVRVDVPLDGDPQVR